jgi:esterase/lipase superfamily enzyme
VIATAVGILQAAGVVEAVPEVVWTVLASFGLYSVRDAVGKSNPEVK